MTFDADHFAYSATPIRPDNSSSVFKLQITNAATGELLPIENNPVTLSLNSLAEFSSPGNTSMKGYNISLADFNNTQTGVTVLFLEFTFTEMETLKIMGRVGGNPVDWNADFIATARLGSFTVEKGFLDVQFELNQYTVMSDSNHQIQVGELALYSKQLVDSGEFLTVSAEYSCECRSNDVSLDCL